ncbi:MAG: hypothetical protein B1H04_03345 [Planctomycetales bacterium 4484_123]|nr:MAG: hypothetical protein B1H04_03345 [Planctomycetales bacterium 4484_123]
MATCKVTFLPANVTVEVDPDDLPQRSEGEPGSLLDIALHNAVEIQHACGGNGVCGTCMVFIEAGMENLSETTEDELDTLQRRPDNATNSRLACQAVVKGDVTVRVPE